MTESGDGRREGVDYLQPQGVMVVGVLVQALVVGRVVALLVELATQRIHQHTCNRQNGGSGGGVRVRGERGTHRRCCASSLCDGQAPERQASSPEPNAAGHVWNMW
jgi:hypothetical protein